ncbi:MAG: ABC transporter permease [Anaerolineales bacterium]|nr:ABC transporter permease [Anaerolineales bacterium]
MIDYAIKNILRRRIRSLMTISGITVMMTLVIVITGIVSYQVRTMNAHAAAGSGKINVQPMLAGMTYPAGGIDLPESEAAAVLLDTEAYSQPALCARVLFFTLKEPLYPNQPPELILTGIEAGKEESFTGSVAQDVRPAAGVETFTGTTIEQPVIVGEHAADVYEAETGQEINIGTVLDILGQPYTVAGLLDHSADIVVNNAVILPLDQAQDLLGKEGFVSSILLVAADINTDADILQVIETRYPQLNVVTDDTVRRNAQSGIALFEAMVNTISTVAVLCAAFLIMTVTLITVRERTREIGVLRALGASKWTVIGSVIWEIFLLSLAGSLLGGVASGFILAFALQENLFDIVHILTYLPLAILLTLAAGLVPALNISRILPVEALRYE